MVFIPIGLQSKVKDPPFLVAIIAVITAFISIGAFHQLSEYQLSYVESVEQQKYFFQLRSLYVNTCDVFQDNKTCEYLIKFKNEDSIRSPYAANSDAKRYLVNAEQMDNRLFLDWHSAEAMTKRFTEKQKIEELNAIHLLTFDYQKRAAADHKKFGLLSKNNTTVYSVIKAQLTHADWFHLIGNLVFFMFFGACLEQAMGRTWVFGIYVMGGTLGLLAQVFLSSESPSYVLGASANIFACAGAFLRLYWKNSLQILFSFFFVMNKTIKLPTWSFFVFFVLMQQVSGITVEGDTGVAYLAHLVGLSVGFCVAHVWMMKKNFVPTKYLIFPYENEMLAGVESRSNCKEKLNSLVDLLFYAPSSVLGYKKFYAIVKKCSCEQKCVATGTQHFYTQQISVAIKELLLDKNCDQAIELYSHTHELGCDPKIAIQHLTVDDILIFGNYFYQNQRIDILKSLFTAAVHIFPKEQKYAFAEFLDSINREKMNGGQHVS
jgi:membrane associated rhomboid family serine protease